MLFCVWRTVLEMLQDRGYCVAQTLLDMDEATFEAAFQNGRTDMTLHLLHRELPGQQIRVFFLDRPSLGPAVMVDGMIRKPSITPLLERIGERPGTQGLFVFADNLTLTPPAKRVFEEIAEDRPGYVQWFFDEELMTNVVRREAAHGMHIKLIPAGDVKTINLVSLPRIYVVDRVARYFNAQPGQVLCIHRPSETGAQTVVMRRCVPLVDRNEGVNFQ